MTIDFGTIIKTRRQELGLSQGEVADRACVHRATVNAIESNKRNTGFDIMVSVLSALDLRLDVVAVDGEGEA